MNKNKRLNIIRGGVAKQIPGMPNYYFMKGLPHELGGIDIGKDLEVEGNEVVHVGKDNIKVYSSVPFLNGVSPAEKVLGGDNPITVFREQEQFKKINGLKDDGTKKELGGKDDDKIDFNYDPDIVGTSPKEIVKYYTNKGFGKSPITNKWGFISKNGYNYNSEGRRDRYDKEFDEVNKIGYIGGSPTEARRKFYKSDKRFTQVVDSIADSHGLPRRVLKNSLANEGFIDTAIGDINTNYLKRRKGEAGYDNLIGDNLLNKHIYNIGFTRMGNDDSKTYYNTRKDVKRIIDNSPIKWETVRNINEKDREVLTMDGSNNKANIVIHSALLTSFRNEIKKQHPNWTNDQIDNYTLYRFNYGPYAKGNINDVMKRDKFNAKNYEFRLGGKMNNKTSGLYSLTVDGKNSLHQFPSTGESFARSAKGKVIARGGTKKRYTGEIKADDRSWIEKQYDNIKGYFMNERPDITHAARIASTLGLSELDNIEELITGRKRYDNPNVQTGIAPIAGRKGKLKKSKNKVNIKPKNVEPKIPDVDLSNNIPNKQIVLTSNPRRLTDPIIGDNKTLSASEFLDISRRIPKTISVRPKYGNNPFYTTNTTINNTKANTNPFINGAKQLGTMGRRQFKKGIRDMFAMDEDGYMNTPGAKVMATGVGFPSLIAAGSLGAAIANRINPINSEKTDIDVPYYDKTDTIKSTINDIIPADTLISRNDTIKLDTIKSDTIRHNAPFVRSKVDSTSTTSKVNVNNKPIPTKSNTPSSKVSTSTTSTSATTTINKPVNTRPVNTRQTNNNGSTNNQIDIPEFNTGVNNNNTTYDPIANMIASKSTNYNLDNKIRGINVKPQFPTGKINSISLDNITPLELPENPVKQSKFKTFINNVFNKPNTKDIIGAGSNIVSSIIAHNMNKNMLNDLEYSPTPITRRANKLKTKININPQIDAMRESLANYRQHVNDNTASSRVARALMNRGLNNYTSGINQLYGNKENQETELINKDRLNQQEVTNANIADYNNWRTNKVNFDNSVREKKSENDIGLIGNINAGIQDIISRREKRFNERQNRLALMAANPNVNPLILRDFGIEGITDKDVRNYYKVYGNKNKKK